MKHEMITFQRAGGVKKFTLKVTKKKPHHFKTEMFILQAVQ